MLGGDGVRTMNSVSRTILAGVMLLAWAVVPLAAGEREATVLTIADAIGPATADYFERGLADAVERGAHLVVLRLDTPGGLDTAMRDIIRAIIASPVPVVVYVAPSGARAASAGTYILYAAHVAAMAPGTNLGAATPVQVGGLPDLVPSAPEPDAAKKGDGTEQDEEAGADDAAGEDDASAAGKAKPDSPMAAKMVNDAVAYIRSLAQMRGRNADWAERAVREAASLAAEEALAEGVIELLPADLGELLAALDGRVVEAGGRRIELQTEGLVVREREPDWRSRLLAVITNPNVAYILMLLGIYGLIFELANPGYVLPGVIGAICLLLALFAFQLLPVNYAGVGLVLLGVAFMVAELFVPSFGALGIGGAVAFVIGSVILFETEGTGYEVSKVFIAGFGLASAGFIVAVIAMAGRIHRRPVVSGREEMVGLRAEVLEDFSGRGLVRAHGEVWQALADTPLRGGQKVTITGVDGLTVRVEPMETEDQ